MWGSKGGGSAGTIKERRYRPEMKNNVSVTASKSAFHPRSVRD